MKVFCPNCGSDNEGMAGGRVTCRACTASFEVPGDSDLSGSSGFGSRPPAYAPPQAPARPPTMAPPQPAPGPRPTQAPEYGGMATPSGWAAPPQQPAAPVVTAQPMAGWQPQGMAQVAAPATTNVLAIVSLVCGLMCCIPLVSPAAAIVLGAVGVKQINESGGAQKGKELAVIGIVLGVIGLVLNLLGVISAIVNG